MRLEKPCALLDPDALLRRPGARLMVLAPHPDDESLAAGGLIQRAQTCAVPTTVVFLTAGENNPWPQRVLEHRVWIGNRAHTAWGVRRRAEAAAALRALGAGAVDVQWLGWPDGGVTAKLLRDTGAMLAGLRHLIETIRPTLLILPDRADRHPDHGAAHVLVQILFQSLPRALQPVCLGYVLHGPPSLGVPQHAVFTLSAAERVSKRQAILAHASQVALSRARLLRCAAGEETFVVGLEHQGCAGSRLPWRRPAMLWRGLSLLLVDARGGSTLRLGGKRANLFWRDGSPAACTARTMQTPFFAKLCCPFPSPWVFDGWGWCRMDA